MISSPPDSAMNTQLAAQPREETWGLPLPYQRGRRPGHRSSGEAALPSTTEPLDPERRAAAAGRCTPRRSRGTLKDGHRRPQQLSAECRAAWQQPRSALHWLQASLYSLIRSLPSGRDLPGIGRLPWPAFGCPQIRPRSTEICRPSPDPSQWATALSTEPLWLKSRDTSAELKKQSRTRSSTPAMAHQAGQAMERGGTGNLSPNLSPLPWPIGEKSIGATGFEPAT